MQNLKCLSMASITDFGNLVGSAHANLKFSWCSWQNVIGHFGPTLAKSEFQNATSGKFWSVSRQRTHKPEIHWSIWQNVVGHFGPLTPDHQLYSASATHFALQLGNQAIDHFHFHPTPQLWQSRDCIIKSPQTIRKRMPFHIHLQYVLSMGVLMKSCH